MIPAGTEATIGPGDQLQVPAGIAATYRNIGADPAEAVVATILPADAPVPAFPPSVSARPILVGVAPSLPSAPAFVVVFREVLGPDFVTPIHTHPGVFAAAVDAGGFGLTVFQGAGFVARVPAASGGPGTPAPTGTPIPLGAEVVVGPGETLLYGADAVVLERFAGEEELVFWGIQVFDASQPVESYVDAAGNPVAAPIFPEPEGTPAAGTPAP